MLVAMSLSEILERVAPDDILPLLVICVGCATAVLITLGVAAFSVFNSMHRRRHEQQLKREMLSMGLSTEEIERVVQCTAKELKGDDG